MSAAGIILKILSGEDWARLQVEGAYAGSAADLADGYIHFSTLAQAPGTLAKHYQGREGLMLVAVSAAALGPALRWEPARGGDLFPHLYGPLPLAAVRGAAAIGFEDGVHVLPAEAATWG